MPLAEWVDLINSSQKNVVHKFLVALLLPCSGWTVCFLAVGRWEDRMELQKRGWWGDWIAKFGELSLLSISLGKQLGVTGKVWYGLVDKAVHWPWEESRGCNSPRDSLQNCDVCSPLHSSYWLPTWAMVLNTKTVYLPDKKIKTKKKAPELFLKILKRNIIFRDECTRKEKQENGLISTC